MKTILNQGAFPPRIDTRSDFARCKALAKKVGAILERQRRGYTVTINTFHGDVTEECDTLDDVIDAIQEISNKQEL